MFDCMKRENLDSLAANIFVELCIKQNCPPSVAARAAFDRADAFFEERRKHIERSKLKDKK